VEKSFLEIAESVIVGYPLAGVHRGYALMLTEFGCETFLEGCSRSESRGITTKSSPYDVLLWQKEGDLSRGKKT
jgi:hypothetical protein